MDENSNRLFRVELRDLLTLDAGEKTFKGVQGKLSVNHILDRGLNGRLRFRPLTPHTINLSATPVQYKRGIPAPGAHTDEVLAEFAGLTPAEIAAAKASGVV